MVVTLARIPLFFTLSSTPSQSAPQIAEKALAATVSLEMQDGNGTILSKGSGFFVRHDLIATNYHVIKEAAQGTAKLVGTETKYTIEGFTATDKTNDLTLLKITVQGINPLPLGDSDTVRIGETVYVVGNPRGLEGTFSNGIISSLREEHTNKRLQMTAPISPGSSGGPVLNDKGEVIGVSIASYPGQETQNLNFASHSNALKKLLTRSGLVRSLSRRKPAIPIKVYLLLGSKKEKLGDYKGAIAYYTKAIRFKPDDSRAYYSRGIAKGKLGQHFAAIADYDTAIQLKPDDVNAYYSRGIAQRRLGQYAAAIADYDIVIRLIPDFAHAYRNRGLVRGKLRLYKEAKQDLRTAWNLADRRGNESLKALIEEDLKVINRFDCSSRAEEYSAQS